MDDVKEQSEQIEQLLKKLISNEETRAYVIDAIPQLGTFPVPDGLIWINDVHAVLDELEQEGRLTSAFDANNELNLDEFDSFFPELRRRVLAKVMIRDPEGYMPLPLLCEVFADGDVTHYQELVLASAAAVESGELPSRRLVCIPTEDRGNEMENTKEGCRDE